MPTYMVRRHYQRDDLETEVLMTGLSLEAAKAYCDSPEAASKTANSRAAKEATKVLGEWFDSFTEEPGPAEKTEYLRRELLAQEDPDIYNRAVEAAFCEDIGELRTFIIATLRTAREGSAMHAVSQQLTDADMDAIDWEAIRRSLTE